MKQQKRSLQRGGQWTSDTGDVPTSGEQPKSLWSWGSERTLSFLPWGWHTGSRKIASCTDTEGLANIYRGFKRGKKKKQLERPGVVLLEMHIMKTVQNQGGLLEALSEANCDSAQAS